MGGGKNNNYNLNNGTEEEKENSEENSLDKKIKIKRQFLKRKDKYNAMKSIQKEKLLK